MSNELTAIEIRDALKALRNEIGPKAYVSVDIAIDEIVRREDAVSGSIYPQGITGRWTIRATAPDFASIIAKLNSEWTKASAGHDRQMIRDMALEIIRITADMGACSDAALRAGKFSGADVTKYGERACVEANEIASNGPFTITPIAAISNAA